MPWHMEPASDGKVFVVDDTGKKYSEKPIPKWRAKKQMAALYAAEPQKKELTCPNCGRKEEKDLSIDGMNQCPNCKQVFEIIQGKITYIQEKAGPTKDGLPSSSYLIVEDPQVTSTWHLAVRDAQGKPDHQLMGAAWAALHEGFRGNKYEGPKKGEALSKLVDLYKSEDLPTPAQKKGFSVFKQADGQYRWVTISSSAFKDRDGEIITQKALAEDVERCDNARSYGPLRWWHIGTWEAPDGVEHWETWKAGAGLDLGICDFNMLHDKVLIESGTFKDATTGEAFAQVQDGLEVSIGFAHPLGEPGESKQYSNIHRFERSLLPAGMASNLLTKAYIVKGESTMEISKKIKALRAIFQDKPELAAQILADASGIQKAAEAAGLETKEVEEMFATSPEGETTQPPEETAPEPPAAQAPPEETTKQAPPPPPQEAPMDPMMEEIGDMTRKDLATFVTEVVKQLMGKKEADAELKEINREKVQAELVQAIKSQAETISTLEHTLKETKQILDDLTDARPVGVKQLQAMRPSQRSDNIAAQSSAGPQIDQSFLDYVLGGK